MSESMKQEIPKGVIAIMISPDGDVIATADDFHLSRPGGFQIWEAQRSRARDRIAYEALRAYSSPALSENLGGYERDLLLKHLLKNGHKIFYRGLGYDAETETEIRRWDSRP